MPKLSQLDHIANLVITHLQGELSAEQQQELDHWINASSQNKAKFEELTGSGNLLGKFHDWKQAGDSQEAGWQKIQQLMQREQTPIPTFRINRLYVAAAAIVLVMGVGGFWLMSRPKPRPHAGAATTVASVSQPDVAPGSFKARLTLADGTTVVLDSVEMNKVLKEGNTAIVNKNGQLVYDHAAAAHAGKESFNTLTTANGETYALTMSDGSKVWLNAASSIHYPVVFAGKERRVTVTGEAYFEVAHDPSKPFKVTANGIQTEVLGTKFNINSYNEEAVVKTTLLEGKIRVSAEHTPLAPFKILQPGQQAQFNEAKSSIDVLNNIDTEDVMAWKNGRFAFNDTGIELVMRQLQRWYGVDIAFGFDTKKQPINVNGQISRFSNVSKVLDMLETTGLLQFKIEGKKITVNIKQ